MSNGGAVSAAVGDGEKLAAVRAFREEFFDGLEEEPFGERDLAGRGCSLGADAGNDDFLGGRREGREREGFEFGI